MPVCGVLRDHKGDWKGGFMASIHTDNVAVTEGWAILQGIYWAWDKGCRKLEIQSDSRNVIEWIEVRSVPEGPLRNIIEECRRWKMKSWAVSFKHVYREQNVIADCLAKLAARDNERWKDLGTPPREVEEALLDDRMGMSCIRRVYLAY